MTIEDRNPPESDSKILPRAPKTEPGQVHIEFLEATCQICGEKVRPSAGPFDSQEAMVDALVAVIDSHNAERHHS